MSNFLRGERSSLFRSATIGLVASTALLGAGCGGPTELDAKSPCNAVSISGDIIRPTAYPLGKIVVLYDNPGLGDYYENVTSKGVIEKDSTGYRLDVKDLPKSSDLDNVFGNEKGLAAAVGIDSAETGEIGFTEACVEADVDANNIPTSFVRLPAN